MAMPCYFLLLLSKKAHNVSKNIYSYESFWITLKAELKMASFSGIQIHKQTVWCGEQERYLLFSHNKVYLFLQILFYSHGFGEYFCPSYDGIAEALVNNGFLVFGHDHIGHGRSTGQRVQVKSMDEYVLPLLGTIRILC